MTLAISYDKRTVAYSPDPTLARDFSDAVERFSRIAEVERFLREHVSVSA